MSDVVEAVLVALRTEVGVMRRLLDAFEVASSINDIVDPLLRVLSEVRDCDAAPSVNDSRMRSNLRFLLSIAYDITLRAQREKLCLFSRRCTFE